MPDRVIIGTGRQLGKTVLYGLMSFALYLLLYAFAAKILALASLGEWYFLVPVAIALVFSFVHGTFTAHFWDLLGIKAKG